MSNGCHIPLANELDVKRQLSANQSGSHQANLKKVAKGAEVAIAGRICSTGVKFLTQLALAWFLGAERFGLYALGFTIYQLGELFSGMGLHSGAVRFVAIHYGNGDEHKLKGTLLLSVGLPLVVGAILGLSMFFAADWVSTLVFDKPDLAPSLRVFALALPFGACVTVVAFATTGFQITKYLVYIRELFQPLLNCLLIVFLCLAGWGLVGAALAWLITAVLGVGLVGYCLHQVFPAIYKNEIKATFEMKKLVAFSLPLALGELSWLLLLWTDVLILGYFQPADEVGVYRAAAMTSLLLIIFCNSFGTIFGPVIANLYNQNQHRQMEKLFETVTRWSFSLTLPIFLILCLTGEDLLRIFGEDFTEGWVPLVILGGGYLMVAATGSVHNMLVMSGHQYLKLRGDIILAISNIGMNILLIPRWGMIGAAVATAISIGGVHILRIFQVYRVLGVQPYSWSYLKVIGAGALAGAGGFLIQQFSTLPFVVSIMSVGGVICVIYLGCLWKTHHDEGDRMIFEDLRVRFLKCLPEC